ncbi:hypothetical protein [Candidatus Protofrankia californiensis]|uniref:hypothetical protein n=1 Tax=Candidatus Protofrankia californiensis TaxID=1839754 RepID=UPI0010419D0A|nr:hypothetical protein [Candidatus Protofrankia californiensis]
MPKERQIRVYGVQREDIDIDLMTQIVMQMGRQLAQETMTDEAAPLPSMTVAFEEEPADEPDNRTEAAS